MLARQGQIVDEEINYLQKDLRLALYKCLMSVYR